MAINYIKSENIHVFPCAYRTQKTDDTGSPNNWDPEARLNTEKNFTNLATGLGKKSYIISWDGTENTKLCCVIGGYYFEIAGEKISSLKNKYLCIKVISDTIIDNNNTKILGTFDTDTSKYYLDRPFTEGTATVYKFTGLAVSDEITGTDYLQVVENNLIKYDEFLPNTITRGQNENTVVIGKYSAFTSSDSTVIIANGTDVAHRSNILEVTKNCVYNKEDLEVAGTSRFNKAIYANDGLDVTGANLTVGRSNCIITPAGDLTAKGTVNLGEASGTVNISKIGSTTAIKGDAQIDGTLSVTGIATFNNKIAATQGLNVTGTDLTVGGSNFKIETDGNLTTTGKITSNDITVNNSLILSSQASIEETRVFGVKINGKTGLVEKNADLASDSPEASGNSLSFIDTVSQADDGKITATKKSIDIEAGTNQGQIKINGSDYTITNLASNSDIIFGSLKNTETNPTFTIDSDGNLNSAGSVFINTNSIEVNKNNATKFKVTADGSTTINGALSAKSANFVGRVQASSFYTTGDTQTDTLYTTGSTTVKGGLYVNKRKSTATLDIFEVIYPIGYVYISMNDISPADLFGFGTWKQLEDASLWSVTSGASYTNPTKIDASLPNIKGNFYIRRTINSLDTVSISDAGSGPFSIGTTAETFKYEPPLSLGGADKEYNHIVRFNANKNNTIYTDDTDKQDIVVPTAYKVYMWVRQA